MSNEQLKQVVLDYDRAVHSADPSAALAHCTSDAQVEVMGQPAYGIAQHIGFLRMFATAFSDQTSTHDAWTIEGDRVATRWRWEGTHTGEFMGTKATGKRVQFGGLGIMTVRDGKVARVVGEGDLLALLRQIGALPT